MILAYAMVALPIPPRGQTASAPARNFTDQQVAGININYPITGYVSPRYAF